MVAPPTGAPGEEVEVPALPGAALREEDREDGRRWAAEAQRLLADRPPHWG